MKMKINKVKQIFLASLLMAMSLAVNAITIDGIIFNAGNVDASVNETLFGTGLSTQSGDQVFTSTIPSVASISSTAGFTLTGLSGDNWLVYNGSSFTGGSALFHFQNVLVTSVSYGSVGYGYTLSGTVVPEPATLAIFGLGLLAMGFTVRRKMKK